MAATEATAKTEAARATKRTTMLAVSTTPTRSRARTAIATCLLAPLPAFRGNRPTAIFSSRRRRRPCRPMRGSLCFIRPYSTLPQISCDRSTWVCRSTMFGLPLNHSNETVTKSDATIFACVHTCRPPRPRRSPARRFGRRFRGVSELVRTDARPDGRAVRRARALPARHVVARAHAFGHVCVCVWSRMGEARVAISIAIISSVVHIHRQTNQSHGRASKHMSP